MKGGVDSAGAHRMHAERTPARACTHVRGHELAVQLQIRTEPLRNALWVPALRDKFKQQTWGGGASQSLTLLTAFTPESG